MKTRQITKTSWISVLVVMLFTFNLAAQETPTYTKVPQFDKYVGSWVYSANGKTFTLHLSKKKVFVQQVNAYVDRLEGYYDYKNSSSNELTDKTKNKIEPGRLYDVSGNMVVFFISDPVKEKRGEAYLSIDTVNHRQAKLQIREKEGFIINKPSNPGFSIPTELTLKKL